jgi:SAM-dependent methyltransferase
VSTIRANAHDLPFAPDEFDVIVSVDAFEYFGTADNYLPHIIRFLVPEGQLAIATPALAREVRDLGAIPEHIKALVGWKAIAWHTADWWRFQWEITELVEVTAARLQSTGCRDWLLWARACREQGAEDAQATIDMLEADDGNLVSFAMVVARKLPPPQRSE